MVNWSRHWATSSTGLSFGKDLQGIREGDEDLEVTSIKVAYKGHHNSRSQILNQSTFGGAHRTLMTYEINLVKKQQEGEEKKKKSIALKVTTKEEEEMEEKNKVKKLKKKNKVKKMKT
ncbi:hypothetical protein CK203_093902 [Vitis vinifera]|uniref:Uncharacterized protein n=1 Tax=Vitis vinifera TaxID=29760 RepID=A0A438C7C0_VITVI|nr:hypothetical protein CK203_093902 [Vitis vinifera]